MDETRTLKGIYRTGTQHTSTNWDQLCADHEAEFPLIYKCALGTFNVLMTDLPEYIPPGDAECRKRAIKRGESVKRYEHGNHIAPRAKVIKINEKYVEAWIYRGGNPVPNTLELISFHKLAEYLNVQNDDKLTVVIEEVDEGTIGMPEAPPDKPGKTITTNFDISIIDTHEQLDINSCIPSAVEMILKLLKEVPADYYDLQKAWEPAPGDNFSKYDGIVIENVKFELKFNLSNHPRGTSFPLDRLFNTIDDELQAGRFVAISLEVKGGWHNYIIYKKNADGEYSACTKCYRDTCFTHNVKARVEAMGGTDILVYTEL
ncbi:MAG: hypothetical protein ACLQF0_03545 [Dissulfurispiraceae bacterium]